MHLQSVIAICCNKSCSDSLGQVIGHHRCSKDSGEYGGARCSFDSKSQPFLALQVLPNIEPLTLIGRNGDFLSQKKI